MSASRVFMAMLTSGMEETVSKCIDMEEYSNTAVKHFLEYLYTGTLLLDEDEDDDEDEDEDEDESSCLVQLWVMGDKYDVPSLVEFVESLREEHITMENVIGVFIEVDALEAAPIRDTCLALISKKIQELPHHAQAKIFQQLIKKGVSF